MLIAPTAYCHKEKLGDVLRTVIDNIQEPKLSVKAASGGVWVYDCRDIAASVFSDDNELLFSDMLLKATEI